MPRLGDVSALLIDALLERYGPQSSTDGGPTHFSGPFEAILRAGLALVADSKRADAALEALRSGGLSEAEALASVDPLEIEELFKLAKVRIPARVLQPIRKIARWASDHGFDSESLRSWSTEALREEWRGLNGVGPATADSLLLFGLGRPTYPVDRSTHRILVRHGWLDGWAEYDEARSVAEGIAPENPESLRRLSLDFARVGRDYCKPSAPRCEQCPLRPLLPTDGPVELME